MTTVYFGAKALQIVPTAFKLLAALCSGVVGWPGPRIHDPDHSASTVRERLGVGYQHLFPTFVSNTLGVVAALAFSLLTFLSSTSLLPGYVSVRWTWSLMILALIGLAGGRLASKRAQHSVRQIKTILADLSDGVEPRAVHSQSAEAAYAIEHPLIRHQHSRPDTKRALDLFYESATYHQEGNQQRALLLYQEALRVDPSLHDHACEALLDLSQGCSMHDQGAIFYWLGIHADYLMNRKQAAAYYQKAADAFHQIGYDRRESRARCNLGTAKMRLNDPSAMEEYEKAVALDPGNGTAHLNIGRTYYRISGPGDPRHERALDAFADAVLADPMIYGPTVISSLRQFGYTWQEDLEEITQRVESRRNQAPGDHKAPTMSDQTDG
jgi:tetratricopeptide (TPR) repeat protein